MSSSTMRLPKKHWKQSRSFLRHTSPMASTRSCFIFHVPILYIRQQSHFSSETLLPDRLQKLTTSPHKASADRPPQPWPHQPPPPALPTARHHCFTPASRTAPPSSLNTQHPPPPPQPPHSPPSSFPKSSTPPRPNSPSRTKTT